MTATAWDADRFAADREFIRGVLGSYVVANGAMDDGRPFRNLTFEIETQLDLDLSQATLAECVHLQAAYAAVDTDGIDGMTHRHPEYDTAKNALRAVIADSLDATIRRLIGDHYLIRSKA